MSAEIRAVVFDAVGTLIFADPPVEQVYHQAGRKHGSAIDASQIKHRFRALLSRPDATHTTSESMERQRWASVVSNVFSDVDDTSALFEELWNHFSDANHWRLYDDVGPTWLELLDQGLTVAVASNFDQRLLGIVPLLSPLHRAHNVFVSSKVGFVKPSADFFRSVADVMQTRPSQLMMVGDSRRHDYDGARDAGWNALLLDRSGRTSQRDSISNLTDIPGRLSTT